MLCMTGTWWNTGPAICPLRCAGLVSSSAAANCASRAVLSLNSSLSRSKPSLPASTVTIFPLEIEAFDEVAETRRLRQLVAQRPVERVDRPATFGAHVDGDRRWADHLDAVAIGLEHLVGRRTVGPRQPGHQRRDVG